MPKIRVLFLAAMLVVLPALTFGVAAVRAEEAPVRELVFERCEDETRLLTYDKYNGLSEYVKKEGTYSFRCDTYWASQVIQYLRFGLDFEVPLDVSGMRFADTYLEFWMYVWDVAAFRHTVNSYLTVGANDSDCYRYELSHYPFEQGWNRISLNLAEDFVGLNGADFGSLTCLRMQIQLERPCVAYLDEFILTETPRAVLPEDLSYRVHPTGVEYRADAAPVDRKELFRATGWLRACAILTPTLLSVGAAASVCLWTIRRKRRGK